MKFVIGSASKRKVDTAEGIIRQFFDKEKIVVENYNASSDVPETPYGKQTFEGAINRARNTKNHITDGQYYIGLESGLVERYGHLYEEAWAAIIAPDGREYFGYSSGLKIPDYILKRMKDQNMEHCDVMAIIEKEFGKLPNDTWGTYSGGIILRKTGLEEALRNALVQVVKNVGSFYSK